MKRARVSLVCIVILWVLGFFGSPGRVSADETKTVTNATQVMQEIMRIPEKGIPPALLKDAQGVAVFPGLLKAGFIVGGRYGKGIVSVRQPDGNWSPPSFLTLAGGSFGWQIGAQATDVVLVFKTRRSVDTLARGKFTLGADAAVAAGPVGRQAEAATDIMLKAEIYSYSRSRGLFAGLALEGAVVEMDDKSNAAFYGRPGVTPEEIFSGHNIKVLGAAKRFRQVLTTYAR